VVTNDYPEFMVKKHLDSIYEKIKSLNYPTQDELNEITRINSNKNTDSLKSKLFEKLYIFEMQVF
jgi:hypothetical protein